MGRDADVWAYLKTTRPPGPLSGGRSFLQAQLQFGPPGLKPGLAQEGEHILLIGFHAGLIEGGNRLGEHTAVLQAQ